MLPEEFKRWFELLKHFINIYLGDIFVEKNLRCEVGDYVKTKKGIMWVSKIAWPGKKPTEKSEGERNGVIGCWIMPDNGQILKRTHFHLGSNWRHLNRREKREIIRS